MQGPQHRVLRVVDDTPQLVRPHCASGNERAGDIDERDVHRLLKLREDVAGELVLIVDAARRLADLEKAPERRAKAHRVHGCAVGTDDGCHDAPVRDVADEPLEILLRLRGEFPAELHGGHRERVDEVVLRGPTGHLGRLVGDVRNRVGHERIVDIGEADGLVAVHAVHDVDLDAVARIAIGIDVVGIGTEELPNRAASGARRVRLVLPLELAVAGLVGEEAVERLAGVRLRLPAVPCHVLADLREYVPEERHALPVDDDASHLGVPDADLQGVHVAREHRGELAVPETLVDLRDVLFDRTKGEVLEERPGTRRRVLGHGCREGLEEREVLAGRAHHVSFKKLRKRVLSEELLLPRAIAVADRRSDE